MPIIANKAIYFIVLHVSSWYYSESLALEIYILVLTRATQPPPYIYLDFKPRPSYWGLALG